MVDDAATPIHLRRLALRMLRPDYPKLSRERWNELLSSDDAELRLEAVRSLRGSRLDDRAARLTKIAEDAASSRAIRGEAIVGLDISDDAQRATLISLATGDEAGVRDDARRALAGAMLSAEERARLRSAAAGDDPEALARLVDPANKPKRPEATDVDAWLAALGNSPPAGDGDAMAGRRVFFSRVAACANCHQVDGRGGRIGPDLTLVAGQLSRERLLESILDPSKEVAPQFVPYAIRTEDGRTFTGVFVGEDGARNQQFGDTEGKIHRVAAEQIEDRKPIDKSLMPDNYGQTLTVGELRDLLAFLRSRSGVE
jgi:hypothetical protein